MCTGDGIWTHVFHNHYEYPRYKLGSVHQYLGWWRGIEPQTQLIIPVEGGRVFQTITRVLTVRFELTLWLLTQRIRLFPANQFGYVSKWTPLTNQVSSSMTGQAGLLTQRLLLRKKEDPTPSQINDLQFSRLPAAPMQLLLLPFLIKFFNVIKN